MQVALAVLAALGPLVGLAGCAEPDGGVSPTGLTATNGGGCRGPTRLQWDQPEVHGWASGAGFAAIAPGFGFPVDAATTERIGPANLTSITTATYQGAALPPVRFTFWARDPRIGGHLPLDATDADARQAFLDFARPVLAHDEATLEAEAESFAASGAEFRNGYHYVDVHGPYSTADFLAGLGSEVQTTWSDPGRALLATRDWLMGVEVEVLEGPAVTVNKAGLVEFETPDHPRDALDAANATFAGFGWDPPAFANLRVIGTGPGC